MLAMMKASAVAASDEAEKSYTISYRIIVVEMSSMNVVKMRRIRYCAICSSCRASQDAARDPDQP